MRLKEIAAMANVSPSTVSMVMKNRKGVSDRKRSEILKLLKENGYLDDEFLNIYTSNKAEEKIIRFIKYKKHSMLVDGNPGFINSIIDAIEMECRKQGYILQMNVCQEDQLESVLSGMNEEPAAGVLLLGTELSDEDLRQISKNKIPTVVLDNYAPGCDINSITMNNCEAIFHAVKHLKKLGHEKIGFIENELPSNNCKERKDAFIKALKTYDLPFDERHIFKTLPTPEHSYETIFKLVRSARSFPTAFVANNDSIAVGAVKAFKENGIRVPEDIAIIGFDNISLASMTDPPLTTLSVPCVEMGIWSVRLLSDYIKYPLSAKTKMQISTALVVRNSTIERTVFYERKVEV